MKFQNSQSGFTLIELLVVVSIIGLLSSVVLVGTVGARKNSRDTVRKQTLRQLQKALEMYYEDNGRYPTPPWQWQSSNASDHPAVASAPDSYIPGLVPKYISKLPQDPYTNNTAVCGAGWKSSYLYLSDGTDYKLMSHCSVEVTKSTDSLNDPHRDGSPGTADINNGNACNGVGDNTAIYTFSVYSSGRSRCW
jgi:type II secretion system protein G